MQRSALRLLSFTGLFAALALPALAQSVQVIATIPFEFAASRTSLPAGEYEVKTVLGSPNVLAIYNQTTHESAMIFCVGVEGRPGEQQPRLVFQRYGDRYFLSQVWSDRQQGSEMLKTRAERELDKSASNSNREELIVLARR